MFFELREERAHHDLWAVCVDGEDPLPVLFIGRRWDPAMTPALLTRMETGPRVSRTAAANPAGVDAETSRTRRTGAAGGEDVP